MNRVATLTQSRDAEESSGSLVPSGFYRERRALGLCRGSTPSRLQVDSFRMDFFFFFRRSLFVRSRKRSFLRQVPAAFSCFMFGGPDPGLLVFTRGTRVHLDLVLQPAENCRS